MTAETDLELNFGTPVPKAEPGSYPAICVGVTPFTINENTPESKVLLRWEFSLDGIEDPDAPGFNVILDGVTSTATGPKSKMRAWVTSLIGHAPDERIGLSELRKQVVSKPAVVKVEINESGYSKVADVLPPMRTPTKPKAAAESPDELPFS